MNDDRRGGIALIAGSVVMLVVMLFHPTGHSLSGERFHAMALLNRAVHLVAILALPVFFFGASVLTRRLATRGGRGSWRSPFTALRSRRDPGRR